MIPFHSKGLLAAACGLFCFVISVAPASAQEKVRGRVADAADNPIVGAVVLLHAVTEESGRELDRDTADANGEFELSYEFEPGPLYFVATRVDGEIFMAEPFREPITSDVDLRAGTGVEPLRMDAATDGAAPGAAAPVPARESEHGGWWVLAMGAAIVAAVLWVVQRSRRRAPRARELMLEIARLDETRAAAAGIGDDAYRARRDDLRARLVEALELDPDADRH
jgi:hypothetical protein